MLRLEDSIYAASRHYGWIPIIRKNAPFIKQLLKVSDIIEMMESKIDVTFDDKWVSDIHALIDAHNKSVDYYTRQGIEVPHNPAHIAEEVIVRRINRDAIDAIKERRKEDPLARVNRYSAIAASIESDEDQAQSNADRRQGVSIDVLANGNGRASAGNIISAIQQKFRTPRQMAVDIQRMAEESAYEAAQAAQMQNLPALPELPPPTPTPQPTPAAKRKVVPSNEGPILDTSFL